MLNGYLVQWSIRRSLAAQSAVEAEIQAAGLGCTHAVAVLNLVKGLIEGTLTVELPLTTRGALQTLCTLRQHGAIAILAYEQKL